MPGRLSLFSLTVVTLSRCLKSPNTKLTRKYSQWSRHGPRSLLSPAVSSVPLEMFSIKSPCWLGAEQSSARGEGGDVI